jgi:hypothetical protein
MSPDEFREIALSFNSAIESSHMNHPDFRAHGRIFATLSYPDASTGMVKLALPDQQHFVAAHPQVFYPAQGAWGLQGSTMVRLAAAEPGLIAQALELAWKHSAQAAVPPSPKKSRR